MNVKKNEKIQFFQQQHYQDQHDIDYSLTKHGMSASDQVKLVLDQVLLQLHGPYYPTYLLLHNL